MTPETARRITANVRRLQTAGLLTAHDFTAFDVLMWRVRKMGKWDCDPDYATIARLGHICRSKAIGAVKKLVTLGIITKTKRHALIRWGRNRAQVAARQISNRYWFCAPSIESSPRAADSGFLESKKGSDRLEAALAGLGRAVAYSSTRYDPIRTGTSS